ncbi:MAG: beta-hydroxyacyl-ACP dehydratase [Planctomycetaceae bacterium]|jgi:3-hydroxyacyl-[acyl-carrier-protein] dehydratase|nr:beta-hydroxyacyl-ACP dehydratase [Planctomycetaceae bacterium]
MRFCLIDQITAIEAGNSISAIKNLSLAEEYLQDHFPGFPVIPGVLMLEAMVQASSWLMHESNEFQYSTILLKQAKAIKFNHFLQPGKTLVVESKIHKSEGEEVTFKASGTVDDISTVSARLTLKGLNLVDRDPSLASADERNMTHNKQLFRQLWSPKMSESLEA